MADRFPGGVISKTPPTVVAPVDGEGGSASGVWTLDEVLGYQKAGAWPKPLLPRELVYLGLNNNGQLGDGTASYRSSPVQVGTSTQLGAGICWQRLYRSNSTAASLGLGQRNDGQLGQNIYRPL
jgi:hypothetical protein